VSTRVPDNHEDHTPLNGAEKAVKAIALFLLAGLTATGFAVSYTRLHDFMARFGEVGWTAYATAAMVDTLTMAGLLVALVFLSGWARIAFVLGLGFTGFANAYIGLQVAGAFGLVVGLVPIIAMELSYRTALSLMFPSNSDRPSKTSPTPPSKPGGRWRKLSKLQEKSSKSVETSREDLETVESVVENPPEPSKNLEEIPPRLEGTLLDSSTISRALLESGLPLPSRKEIMETYQVSEWTARQALQAARKGSAA